MSYVLSNKLPSELLGIIYKYSRNKTVHDYHYRTRYKTCQLFYNYHQQPISINTFWVYDIWCQPDIYLDLSNDPNDANDPNGPNGAKTKAIEITIRFTHGGIPYGNSITITNTRCFTIKTYYLKDGWALALDNTQHGISIKLMPEMDTWERQRWALLLHRLYTMSYLDKYLHERLLRFTLDPIYLIGHISLKDTEIME